MKNFAVFASGYGSNLQAIINAVKNGKIRARLALVVSDNQSAYALVRAKRARIKSVYINPNNFPKREAFDGEVLKHLRKEKIDFVVLAGFMRILSAVLLRAYPNKILNIHPALLPKFKGAHAIQDAYDSGAKITGVTVHFIDDKVDHGPIVMQESLAIRPKETLKVLEQRIHKIEHRIYPEAIDLLARGRLAVKGLQVKIR